MLAAAEALRERLGTPIPPVEAADRDAAVDQLVPQAERADVRRGLVGRPRAASSTATIDAAVEAIDDARRLRRRRASAEPPRSSPRASSPCSSSLAQGHTNREIAAALYISPSTAGVHVSNILRKLGAKRRVDAAGIAHKMGLLRSLIAAGTES